MALTYSFYAEVAAARGDTEEARKRRFEVLAFYTAQADDPFMLAARTYSQAKLGLLDGDLVTAERCYRESANEFARLDRPMMRSMCVGMVADFDERNGDYGAAIEGLEEAIQTNDALGLRGFMGALLTRLGWALLQDGNPARAEFAYARALDIARRLNSAPAIYLALAGAAVLHRINGRNGEATSAAVEALARFQQGAPRRLSNRVDAQGDVLTAAAVCCTVLAGTVGR